MVERIQGAIKTAYLHLLVNAELINYVKTMFGSKEGDSRYNDVFDVGKDGKIDMKDIAWFSKRLGRWTDIEVKTLTDA